MSINKPNELYKSLIRSLQPEFGDVGYRKDSYSFKKILNNNIAIIGFQKSTKSTRDVISFTVNVALICGKLLEKDHKSIQKAQIADAHLRERLGRFTDYPTDKWWEISCNENITSIDEEIRGLIFRNAVPYIDGYLDNRNLIALWETGRSPGITDRQRLRYLTELKNMEIPCHN